MAEQTTSSIDIEAAPAEVMAVIADFEAYPQWAKGVTTADLLATSDRDEKLVIVGDALMHPAELMDPGGSMYLYSQTRASGIEWLRRLAHHFRSAAWLNPEPDRYWAGTTIEVIASVFPMYPLTLDGLAQAVRYLVAAAVPELSLPGSSPSGD